LYALPIWIFPHPFVDAAYNPAPDPLCCVNLLAVQPIHKGKKVSRLLAGMPNDAFGFVFDKIGERDSLWRSKR